MRRKNLNALERMQREKIGVAGDDVASPAAHRKFEEFVVLWISASVAKESRILPSRRASSSAWRGFESGRSSALTNTFVSKTQRNYAPFSRESSSSGVSPRSFALRPTSSSTCCSDEYSPAASSRSQRLNRA